jgi:hypothetical protein
MRTKTLLLTAALSAAGLATSLAQSNVYSLNVVGYVNYAMPGRFAMIANPLNGTNNGINSIATGFPVGTLLYKFSGGTFTTPAEKATATLWDLNLTLNPGEGAFVELPAGSFPYTNTWVGEVIQGTTTNTVPSGYAILSSDRPQAGGLVSVLGFPVVAGDFVYRFNKNNQNYNDGVFESAGGNVWADGIEPTVEVGQAFWSLKGTGSSWVRNFTVPQ